MGFRLDRYTTEVDNTVDDSIIIPDSEIKLAANDSSHEEVNNVVDYSVSIPESEMKLAAIDPAANSPVANDPESQNSPKPIADNQIITDLDALMELTAPLNGAEEAEKQSVLYRNINSTPSQITGLNAYVAGDQKPAANVNKVSLQPDFKVVDREESESDDSSNENGSESMSDTGLSDYGELAIHTTIFSFISKLLTVAIFNH